MLSSGVLRTTVSEVLAEDSVRLAPAWGDGPSFLVGASVRIRVGAADAEAVVASLDDDRVILDPAVPGVRPGAAVELSTGEEAPILAARVVTGVPRDRPLPPMESRLATTRGTNGADAIGGGGNAVHHAGTGRSARNRHADGADLFALDIRKPVPVHGRGRSDRAGGRDGRRSGAGPRALEADARAVLDRASLCGGGALGTVDPPGARARRAGRMLQNASASPRVRTFATGCRRSSCSPGGDRGREAALVPVIDGVLDRVRSRFAAGRLMSDQRRRADDGPGIQSKDSLLPGPPGAWSVGRRRRHGRGFRTRVLALTWAARVRIRARERGPERMSPRPAWRCMLVSPAVAVQSVAAGGGSVVCGSRAGGMGRRARCDPGPACYGRGGPLTITDCNLLGLDASRFALLLDGVMPAARAREMLCLARAELDGGLGLEQMLSGFIEIADQCMGDARCITPRRGHDPAEHTLVAFGGAGPRARLRSPMRCRSTASSSRPTRACSCGRADRIAYRTHRALGAPPPHALRFAGRPDRRPGVPGRRGDPRCWDRWRRMRGGDLHLGDGRVPIPRPGRRDRARRHGRGDAPRPVPRRYRERRRRRLEDHPLEAVAARVTASLGRASGSRQPRAPRGLAGRTPARHQRVSHLGRLERRRGARLLRRRPESPPPDPAC